MNLAPKLPMGPASRRVAVSASMVVRLLADLVELR